MNNNAAIVKRISYVFSVCSVYQQVVAATAKSPTVFFLLVIAQVALRFEIAERIERHRPASRK
jgi:hypothetical protein